MHEKKRARYNDFMAVKMTMTPSLDPVTRIAGRSYLVLADSYKVLIGPALGLALNHVQSAS